MKRGNIIFDWDGTLTDIDKEFEEFLKIYPQVVLDKLSLPKESITEYKQFEKRVLDDPKSEFYLSGFAVSRGSADPLIATQTAAQNIYRALNGEEGLTNFLVDSYIESAKNSGSSIYFREGFERTKDFLKRVNYEYNLAIVSNSSTEKIENALDKLGIKIPVYGNAGKLFVSEGVLPKLELDGFLNPINLNRDGYIKILNDLKAKGFKQSGTRVIGDCFDLDLALPHYLGYSITQINNGHMIQQEKDFLGDNATQNYSDLEKILF